jgi:2,3-bisphosphoglycerate-independent phosphoglycerate mutase
MILTADHGNAEQMWDATRQAPHTAHTSNPVPVILVGDDAVALREGSLRDVAPTMLRMLELEPTPDMTGADLRTGR